MWRRDEHEDGVITWGALRAQRPDITEGEAHRIVFAGFLYEHEDGTTVELVFPHEDADDPEET